MSVSWSHCEALNPWLHPQDLDGIGLATTPRIYVPRIKAPQMVEESTSPPVD